MPKRTRAEMIGETRAKLLASARKAFAEKGFAGASMDDLTAAVGLTRGALYHHFGDKTGLLAAVVEQLDGEMAARAAAAGADAGEGWAALEAQGASYIEAALDPEIQRIVLLDGPAFLGDPSLWPSQNACLEDTRRALGQLSQSGIVKAVDIDAAARLLNGAALNAALWVATSSDPGAALPKALEAFGMLARGFLADKGE
ncbi:TetR/AcrR family transcriptional regulator [Paracoccus benzoatiresistens]|uniref:TetR/AcrR family transcriptional regulator n=1 Tax=Paracoccus benzoatiresistens TaxID=2997341 RepID=A0ABT4J7A1_9RHOB|nr:TetR/AcrR family transcriptional regulator [Paracoccus sp. EF6]MCZ0962321.1 TetR/AcrR family transcriptional regulator [Paracoccus sp. EF6]